MAIEQIKADFSLDDVEHAAFLTGANVLFYDYSSWSYDGHATLIYELDSKLYEVHGSHCSCYGLEGQFRPEETTFEALCARDWDSHFSCSGAEKDVVDALKALLALGTLLRKVP